MTPDELPENASFGVFDELTTSEPIKIVLSMEQWEQLEKAFNDPPEPLERLRQLLSSSSLDKNKD